MVGILPSIKWKKAGLGFEVYEPAEQYDYLVSTEPPNMYQGDVILEDGEVLTAMLYPRELVEKHNWLDISHYGGWAAYKSAVAAER